VASASRQVATAALSRLRGAPFQTDKRNLFEKMNLNTKTKIVMSAALLAGTAQVMAQETVGSKPAVMMDVGYDQIQGCSNAPELRISKDSLEQILGDALKKRGVPIATSAVHSQMTVFLKVLSCKSVSSGQVDAYSVSFSIGLYKEKVPGGNVVANDASGLIAFGGAAANNQAAKVRIALEKHIRSWVNNT
jgi:hypothetical protein